MKSNISLDTSKLFPFIQKLSGMTGTSKDTEAFDSSQFYSLETVVIPTTNLWYEKIKRFNLLTAEEKYEKHW